MALPFFFSKEFNDGPGEFILDEDTSKHVVQVLRMKNGEQLNLTNGKGSIFTTEIINDHKKKCEVKLISTTHQPEPVKKVSIAISLLKNTSRFEWFLEKATEIGVNEIIPMICSRTEKQHFRFERMQGILESAMIQSQQCWLPVLHEPVKFDKLVLSAAQQQKFIAHCTETEKRNLSDLNNESLPSKIILIGPEGDFTLPEIELALKHHFSAVALGETRLRSETAGMVAATMLCIG